MKFAVITPYYSETIEQLTRCRMSVAGQSICDRAEIVHFMVCDGNPQAAGSSLPDIIHVPLPCNSADAGATPRGIGMALAWTMADIDGVLFLDADNSYEPDHIEQMCLEQTRTGADIVTCPRRLFRPDGSFLGVCTESDGDRFNDTNCYLIMRTAWPIVCREWLCQSLDLGLWSDRLVWNAIKASGLTLARSPRPTLNYVTMVATHYLERGEQPPEGARNIVKFGESALHVKKGDRTPIGVRAVLK